MFGNKATKRMIEEMRVTQDSLQKRVVSLEVRVLKLEKHKLKAITQPRDKNGKFIKK